MPGSTGFGTAGAKSSFPSNQGFTWWCSPLTRSTGGSRWSTRRWSFTASAVSPASAARSRAARSTIPNAAARGRGGLARGGDRGDRRRLRPRSHRREPALQRSRGLVRREPLLEELREDLLLGPGARAGRAPLHVPLELARGVRREPAA